MKYRIDVKIVFLLYVDLLYPPLYEKIKYPERFILMFAPITRDYSKAYVTHGVFPTLPPYVRNNVKFPSSVDENISFLKSWQEIFSGDSFCFDYHLFWDQYIESSRAKILDWGDSGITHVLYDDIRNLENIGLNGLMSCQVQRSFFPTGLSMYVMSRLLWDKKTSYDYVVDEYFNVSFGKDGLLCRNYLNILSSLRGYFINFTRDYEEDAAYAERIGKIPTAISEFGSMIQDNLDASDTFDNVSSATVCIHESWRLLKIHSVFCNLLVYCLQSHALRQTEASRILWNSVIQYLRIHEKDVQSVFDLFEFINTFDAMFT